MTKNQRFIQSILDDLKSDEDVSEIRIARVIKKVGNGRVEVFYVVDKLPVIAQAVIRGSFRGKGKRGAWIDIGSIVAVADVGLAGSAALEIMGVFEQSQIADIKNEMDIDPRILGVSVDTDALLSDKPIEDEGFVFEEITNQEIDAI